VENFISKLKTISTRFNSAETLQSGATQGSTFDRHPGDEPTPRQTRKPWWQFPPLKRLLRSPKPQLSDSLKPRTRKRRPLYRRYWFWILLLAAGGGTGAAIWGYWALEKSLPDISDLSTFVRDGTLNLKAADGTVLQHLGPATREKLSIQQIPDPVIKAFLAAEDRRFYQHNGVDGVAVVRAVMTNLVARDVVEGGSTITQQLARIVYLNQEQTIWRKLQEAMLAQKIEREMSKEQILERYLNLVYLGSGAYGVADAAWVYFSKPVSKLTLSEIATIAGLPPAPSDYSPLVNPNTARSRRDIVLKRMVEEGYITQAQAQTASTGPLTLKPQVPKNFYSISPYFTTYIQQQLPRHLSKEQLEAGGLTVETTLNPRWQKAADNAVRVAVNDAGYYEGFSQAALVAIDPRTGEIRAMVGGADFKNSQFNRATQAQRQPGSAFKTILYTTAIATGMSPHDGYLDASYSIDGYQPQNYGRKYSGWMSLREALTKSVNVISVKLIVDVGFEPVTNLAKAMGIKSKLMPTYSLALGASEVNLLELTNAYGTLANRGKHIEAHGIRRILNRRGEVLYDASFSPRRVVDQTTVEIVTWMMQNVVNSGTGQAARLDRPVAGKTGTSEAARDLWFVGFIPQLVVGVWLGNDDSSPTWSASSTAAVTWHDFMVSATRGMPIESFSPLPNVDWRKGSIKAKPVSGRVGSGTYQPDSSSSDSSGSSGSSSGYREEYREPEPARQEPPADSAPAEPPIDSAPPPEPPEPVAPEPPPPAEPAPPPVEPAPPAEPVPPGT
jgi:penicillin-binding protein 1A